MYGGIYRPVSLLLLPKTCITPLDYASSGIYIHQDQVDSKRAELSIVTKVNSSQPGKALSVRTSVFNAQGKAIGSTTTTNKSYVKGETAKFINRSSYLMGWV